jgi:hypothetical protein
VLAACAAQAAGDIVLPADPRAVIDVKRDCGAKGDGVADDTQALQSAIDSRDGVLTLIDSRLQGPGGTDGPAIKLTEEGYLYAARVTTSGYAAALVTSDAPAGGVTESEIAEYCSHPVETVGGLSPKTGLLLTPQREPDVPWPSKAEDWICANDFGARAGDEDDDAPAFQRAIDAAAEKGASTVYLLGGKRGDPNWYWMKKNVRVHGSVQRIMGFGFVRILGGPTHDPNYPENLAKFVVDADSAGARVVLFQDLQVFAPQVGFGIEALAPDRTVLCRTVGGTILGHCYQQAHSTVWARQWNTEGGPEKVGVNTLNDGGQLWILGMKTEAKSTKVATLHGGRTEVLGVHNYNTSGVKDDAPFFRVENGSLSVAGYREVCFVGAWWKVPVLAVFEGREYRQPPHEWQTWSLLHAGK